MEFNDFKYGEFATIRNISKNMKKINTEVINNHIVHIDDMVQFKLFDYFKLKAYNGLNYENSVNTTNL